MGIDPTNPLVQTTADFLSGFFNAWDGGNSNGADGRWQPTTAGDFGAELGEAAATMRLLLGSADPVAPSTPNPQPAKSNVSLLQMLSQQAYEAERDGFAGFSATVVNPGGDRPLHLQGFQKLGTQQARPTNVVGLTKGGAETELQNFFEAAQIGKGTYQINFTRDPKTGVLHFANWNRIGDPPPTTSRSAAPTQPQPTLSRTQAQEFEQETGMVYPQRINQGLHDIGAHALHDANPFLLKNLPYTIAGALLPIGAMKVLTMDVDQLGNAIRFEWGIDEDFAEAAQASEAGKPAQTPAQPTRELAAGDVIDTPEGPQRVLSVEKGKIVTTPEQPSAATPPQPLRGTTAPPNSPAASGSDTVWVQRGGDGPVRAYRPSEITGDIREGSPANTPDGPGRIVKVGQEPPQSIQVQNTPTKPFFTAEDLNRPVPRDPGYTGDKHMLTSAERAGVNRIQNILRRMQEGDGSAEAELEAFRPHPLDRDLRGWTSLDVVEGNPGGLNTVRIRYRALPNGQIQALLRMGH